MKENTKRYGKVGNECVDWQYINTLPTRNHYSYEWNRKRFSFNISQTFKCKSTTLDFKSGNTNQLFHHSGESLVLSNDWSITVVLSDNLKLI